MLTATHLRDGGELPIGVSVELRDEPDGLHGERHRSEVLLGDEVLALVRDGVPVGLSIGFIPRPRDVEPDRTKGRPLACHPRPRRRRLGSSRLSVGDCCVAGDSAERAAAVPRGHDCFLVGSEELTGLGHSRR
jgi:hypothetical protein